VSSTATSVLDRLRRAQRNHRGTILYTTSSMAKAGMGFVSSVVIMRAVAPADVGLWSTISLVTTYAALLQAGINNGLNRELPFHMGVGDHPRALQLAGTAQAFTLLSCVIALVAGIAALIYFRGSGEAVVTAVAVQTIAAMCFFYQSYLVVTFRSTSSFTRLAKVEFAGVVVGLAALPLVFTFGFLGMLWRVAVTSVLGILFLHAARPVRVGIAWDRHSLSLLLKTGLPIFVLFYIESSFSTFDRVFLLQAGGVEQVGYYSLSLLIQQAMLVVPMSIAVYAYPRMSFDWGKEGSRQAMWNVAWKSTAAAIALMLPLATAAYVALPWIVPMLFPDYAPGIDAARIMLIGSMFNGSAIGANALWSMKAWRYMAAYQLSSAALRAIGPYVGIVLMSDPLLGVAVGTACACVVQFVLGMLLTFRATAGHRSKGPA
jgi:O-antigen/teichoic acid export membrane protein